MGGIVGSSWFRSGSGGTPMVVLQIDGGGYRTASTALTEANQLTALAHTRLVATLAGCGGMAGDDSTSLDFAAAYDAAAAEAVGSLADLVASYAGLGRLTHATLANHARANARAVIGGATVYDGDRLPDHGYVSVLPGTPPPARGATALPALPAQVDWILDHLQGFAWPTADAARLRRAAAAWRSAATALADPIGCCDSAARGLWLERSPEVPLALGATARLRAHTEDVASALTALATSCETYADAVEAKHAEILDLAGWVLEQVVEGVVISVALGFLTGGAGTAAGLAAVAARVAAESPRFAALLEALRVLAEGCATTVRAARDALSTTRLNLVKFREAAVARSLAQGERGEMRLWWTRGRGWLQQHEDAGGHLLARHVARKDEQLVERLSREPKLRFASTFPDQDTAERVVARVLRSEREKLDAWRSSSERVLALEADLGSVTGRTANRAGELFDVTGVRVVLVRDAGMPEGFRIHTAYPRP
ncbi:RNase A-like domain-containing protein [Nocardioides panaciterrulae]|uniref:Bacterial CdiA-CT RNAse A domain-containing protein n=1 Tax=Nocardioides panaciterrulae TaxID=661492 RepID=A0A7Y9E990_9ACTN|nr:RNase A-like domain-containing protein [Nocardioides panaciterrulae]NYD43265.1 hypothetical protein [Nocardioides panaciterrulae]